MRISSSGPAGRLGAAMIPLPAHDVGSWSSWGPVTGSPGTTDIPAPRPCGVPESYAFTALHKSSDAPDYWKPGIYFQRKPPHTASCMARYSDNQMPVPAGTPSGKPAVMARNPTFLGQRQIGARFTTPWYKWRAG